MTLFRLLNIQGIAGIAVSLALAILLVIQKVEIRHWRQQSAQYEQLYGQGQAALQTTELNYRRAAEAARSADRAAAERVVGEQRAINERTSHDYETRLADARSRAAGFALGRLRGETAGAAADPRSRGAAPMPGVSAPASQPDQAADQDGLFPEDALTATEQAIQLDELIKWVERQHEIDPNRGPVAGPQ